MHMERAGAVRPGAAATWPLLVGAGLALLGATLAGVSEWFYHRDGVLYYPSLAFINYSLRGVPLQVPALLAAGLSLAALWLSVRRRMRFWVAAAAFGLLVALTVLIAAARPYRPVARAGAGGVVYQLAAYRPTGQPFDLYLLFSCDATGTICRWVSAYAPFDTATGRLVTGTSTLVVDPRTRAVTLRIQGAVIGVYAPNRSSQP